MSDDYLWDGSGEPDPDVEDLERVLGRLRSKAPAPALPDAFLRPAAGGDERPRLGAPSRDPGMTKRAFLQLAAAVLLAVCLIGGGVWLGRRDRGAAWDVASLEGAPLVGSSAVTGHGMLAVGQWLETDGSSRARIRIGRIGQVTVEPNTRLRLVSTQSTDHRLALARGTLHASISAPPRLFFVETPSAVAADLGCQYTLEVDDQGRGLLLVTTGYVSFEKEGRESIVPAGARCRTRPGKGPGTPSFDDADALFSAALERLDFDSSPREETRRSDLDVVLAKARPRDALTLWHLMKRFQGGERSKLYDRMSELVPPPDGVTRRGILDGDERMFEQWWEDLGFGRSVWKKAWQSLAG